NFSLGARIFNSLEKLDKWSFPCAWSCAGILYKPPYLLAAALHPLIEGRLINPGALGRNVLIVTLDDRLDDLLLHLRRQLRRAARTGHRTPSVCYVVGSGTRAAADAPCPEVPQTALCS